MSIELLYILSQTPVVIFGLYPEQHSSLPFLRFRKMSVFKVGRKKYNIEKSIIYMYILYVNHNINHI